MGGKCLKLRPVKGVGAAGVALIRFQRAFEVAWLQLMKNLLGIWFRLRNKAPSYILVNAVYIDTIFFTVDFVCLFTIRSSFYFSQHCRPVWLELSQNWKVNYAFVSNCSNDQFLNCQQQSCQYKKLKEYIYTIADFSLTNGKVTENYWLIQSSISHPDIIHSPDTKLMSPIHLQIQVP